VNPLLRNSEAHVFVDSLAAPRLMFEDQHHLDRVLRLEENDLVTVCDGNGSWATATWSRPRGVELTSEIHHEPPRPTLTVGVAIPKGDRPELIVQKLTELGINRILLFETARSIVRWDAERRSRQGERLNRIAREAAMQSRRTYIPRLAFTTFEQAIQQNGMGMAEPGGHDPIDAAITGILIGPEGGFDRDELDYAVPKLAISRNVLRVETAAIVAGALLVAAHD
jgi:16S rRNA (uracil1498-N3)-methyltransferase